MNAVTVTMTAPSLRPTPAPSVRLTRRGRLAVFVLALVVVLAVGVLLSSGSAATERPEATEVVVVGSGETLWDIASDHSGAGEVREMIFHLQRLNDLEGSRLYAGQRLRVPA